MIMKITKIEISKTNKHVNWLWIPILFIGLLISGCGGPYSLTADDVVSPANEDLTLTGKLEKRGVFVLNEAIANQDVKFYVNDEFIGAPSTNDKGYAEIVRPGTQSDTATIRVEYGDENNLLAETTAKLFIWQQDQPILVTDIDDTLCQTQEGLLIGISYDDYSEPLPGAPEGMRELAKSFKIVYLTARPREVLAKTKRWLQNNGFPDGPVFTWDIDSDPWSQLEYKELKLDRLKEKFSKITIGLGNTDNDLIAYRDHDLFSIIIAPKSQAQNIEGGVKLPDWTKILELFEKNPQLFNLQNPNEAVELP
jgi:hypothetical protein